MSERREVLFWQRNLWRGCLRLVNEGRLPPAFLLHHEPGFGLSDFAGRLAQAVLCRGDAPDDKPCGGCRACRAYETDNHPDFLLIRPETEAGWIKIERIREMIDYLTISSHYGGKVVLLLNAERLNDASANAMLKTLEEPAKSVTIILACHFPSLLPPTIRSRCRVAHFDMPSPERLTAWLCEESKLPEDECRAHLERAEGRPCDALASLRKGDSAPGRREAFLKDLDDFVAGRMSLFKFGGEWEGVAGAQTQAWLLAWVSRKIRDRLVAREGPPVELLYKLYERQVKRCRPSSSKLTPRLLLEGALHEIHYVFG